MNSWDTLFASENQSVLSSIEPQDELSQQPEILEEEEETYASMKRRRSSTKPRIANRAEIVAMLPDVAKLRGTKLMLMAKSLELFFILNRLELENSFETRTECWGSFEDGEWVSHVRSIVDEDDDGSADYPAYSLAERGDETNTLAGIPSRNEAEKAAGKVQQPTRVKSLRSR